MNESRLQNHYIIRSVGAFPFPYAITVCFVQPHLVQITNCRWKFEAFFLSLSAWLRIACNLESCDGSWDRRLKQLGIDSVIYFLLHNHVCFLVIHFASVHFLCSLCLSTLWGVFFSTSRYFFAPFFFDVLLKSVLSGHYIPVCASVVGSTIPYR